MAWKLQIFNKDTLFRHATNLAFGPNFFRCFICERFLNIEIVNSVNLGDVCQNKRHLFPDAGLQEAWILQEFEKSPGCTLLRILVAVQHFLHNFSTDSSENCTKFNDFDTLCQVKSCLLLQKVPQNDGQLKKKFNSDLFSPDKRLQLRSDILSICFPTEETWENW